jgi:hypothetical protein
MGWRWPLAKVGTDRDADTIKTEGTTVSTLSKDSGMVSFKVLFIFLVLFVVIHIGVRLVPLYIDSEAMKDEMVTKARFAQTSTDADITTGLAKRAKEIGLPLGPDDFKLLRDETTHRMKIGTAWDVKVHFFFDIYPPYTVKTYHFEPIVEEDYTRKF